MKISIAEAIADPRRLFREIKKREEITCVLDDDGKPLVTIMPTPEPIGRIGRHLIYKARHLQFLGDPL